MHKQNLAIDKQAILDKIKKTNESDSNCLFRGII